MKAKTKKKTKGITLEDTVRAAHRAGVKVSYSMLPRENMPARFPDDAEPVKLLIAESERMTALGQKWESAKVLNPRAADACYGAGWAHALSAAWLRAKLKGQFLPDKL